MRPMLSREEEVPSYAIQAVKILLAPLFVREILVERQVDTDW